MLPYKDGTMSHTEEDWAHLRFSTGASRGAVEPVATVLRRISDPDFFGWAPGRQIQLQDVEALRAAPGFQQAMLSAMQSNLALYAGDRRRNLLVNDRARLILGTLALHLYWAPLPGQSGAGLTTSRVREFATRTGLCSPNRAAAMIALMRWGGYLERDDRAADGRMRLLAPTEKLLALHRARWTRMLEAAGCALPIAAEASRRVEEPGFVPVFAVAQTRGFLGGFRFLANSPEVRPFMDRDCAALILFAVLVAQEDGSAPPASVSGLARRFGVSRPHVAKLLRDAESAGLIAAREPAALNRLARNSLERFLATNFLFNEACAKATLSALDD
jgi:hypothetical protein